MVLLGHQLEDLQIDSSYCELLSFSYLMLGWNINLVSYALILGFFICNLMKKNVFGSGIVAAVYGATGFLGRYVVQQLGEWNINLVRP